MENFVQDLEQIQRLAAKIVATHPAGVKLLLIGGFRYRLLDRSTRFSVDIDYHWEGNLDEKQAELVSLCQRVLLPQVRRKMGFDGAAEPGRGAEAESPNARFIDLAFWKPGDPYSRIEIPVEITWGVCLDPVTIRGFEGVIYPTASDADQIENKIVAIVNRLIIAHRDLVDLFLFGDALLPASPARLGEKLQRLKTDRASVAARLRDFEKHPQYHIRAVGTSLESQMDAAATANIMEAGGAKIVFDRALELLRTQLAKLT